MPKMIESPKRWSPQTSADREVVLDELAAILSSHHFRNSKRYPAFLDYVVKGALGGRSDQLKERTLGVEVFDRLPNYDTNTDPVVRFSASEVRKRIAQYYHDNGRESRVLINLPLGSYVPEFKLRPAHLQVIEVDREPDATETVQRNDSAHPSAAHTLSGEGVILSAAKTNRITVKPSALWAAIVLIGVAPVVAFAISQMPTVIDRMWKPLLKSPGSVEIVIGNGLRDVQSPPDPDRDLLATQLHGAYNRVSVCDAVAVSRLSTVLGKHSKPYEIKEASMTSLQDVRDRSVILIGAYNNPWTMRLMDPLRFHFVKDGHAVKIVDTRNPQNGDWAVDYAKSRSSSVYDYAIVARFADLTTNSNILIIAGIGAYGTEAAGEAAASPADLKRLVAILPKDWENKNFELVVRTPIINGEAGPAEAVSATTW
jgi:hypothetical protein